MSPAASPPAGAPRTCLVTGATSGIGREVALALAQRGHRVLLTSRERERGERTVAELRAATGNQAIECLTADLSRQQDVRALAAAVQGRGERLDVLIHNAGVLCLERRVTVDGVEETLAVNHLAPFLLTHLLLDLLRRSDDARVINVGSMAHRFARPDLADLQSERAFKGMRAYALSKFFNVVFTYELARREAGSRVSVHCVHPGGVKTGIWRESRGFLRFLLWLLGPSMVSPARGAEPVVRLATAPVAGGSGQYFVRNRPGRSAPATYDQELARQLWAASARLTGLG